MDELLDSIAETIFVLRDPVGHNGELRPHLTDCADAEFLALWRCCEMVDLDPRGIPAWVAGGRVRGLSTRTTAQHLSWMVADLADRLTPENDAEIHRLLWLARLRSISASRDVASLMQQVRDDAVEDEFAEFRSSDSGAAESA